MPRTRRVVAIALAASLTAAVTLGLAGCVNGPSDGVGWLRGQPGIQSVEIVDSDDSISGTTGQVRGELDPALTDDQLEALVASVAGFLRAHDGVGIRLGIERIDFWVDDSDAVNRRAVALWHDVVDVPNIVSGVMLDGSVHVRSLRPDMEAILGELTGLAGDLRIEGFTDEAALAADESEDNESGDAISNVAAVDFFRASDCEPADDLLAVAVSMFERPALSGASLEVCDAFTLYYDQQVALSAELPALQSELVDANLSEFPVTAKQQVAGAIDGRTAVVTPVVAGDPAAFALFAPFDANPAVDPYLELFDDRSFEVVGFETPVGELVALVASVPAAAASPFIRVEGSDAAVGGLSGELSALVAQAVTLANSSGQFTNVELNTDAGILALDSPVATDPDVPAAVADLRASQAWVGRRFIVTYLQTQLTIVDGVATVDDQYTDGHVIEAFADDWNAG